MSDSKHKTRVDEGGATQKSVFKRLDFLSRWLTLWILLALVIGLLLGLIPGFSLFIESLSVGTTCIPIAIGLILMMYPPLAKVHYNQLGGVFKHWRLLLHSLTMNWIFGPILMFLLGILLLGLQGEQGYLNGVIITGLARCIAMVIVWNELAGGDNEYCAALVAFNSLFQVFLYSVYAWVFVTLLVPLFGLTSVEVNVTIAEVAISVAIYLGIPFVAGLLTWLILRKIKGEDWYYDVFVPKISPLTLFALLFTIVIMFGLQGKEVLNNPLAVLLVAAPFLLYFFFMFFSAFFTAKWLKADYGQCVTLAFTAASNNFELAIAVSVATFGLASRAAFAAVIGPLIEIPVMLALVKVSLYFKTKLHFESEKVDVVGLRTVAVAPAAGATPPSVQHAD